MKKSKKLQRILALLGCITILAATILVPISAIEIGVCTNVNFFDIDSLTLTENEYDTEMGYFSYYPYYEDGALAVTFSFDENYIQSHDQLFIRLGGKGVKNLSTNVNYSMRYSYYFDMHQELSVSLGIVENSEDVIFWEFSPYGTSLNESGLDSVMNDDNTFAIIIETNDLEWIDDGINLDTVYLHNIQVNEMCISDSCEYCADGNPKPYMSYSEEIFTVVGAMRQEIEQAYDEGVTDGYNEGYTDGESDGLTDGYNYGYSEGETAGLTTGYNNGYSAGETAGLTTGYNDGFTKGEESGYQKAIDLLNGSEQNIFENCTLTVDISSESLIALPFENTPFSYSNGGVNMASAYDYTVNKIKEQNENFDTNSIEGITYEFTFNGQFLFSASPINVNEAFYIDDKLVAMVYGEYNETAATYYDLTVVKDQNNQYTLKLVEDIDPSKLLVQKIQFYYEAFEDPATYQRLARELIIRTQATFANNSYRTGYLKGYELGFDEGVVKAQDTAFNEGYDSGFLSGKQEGLKISETGTWHELMLAVTEAPINTFQSLFNFEILGIDMRAAFGAMMSICVLLIIIKKVIL